MKFTSAFFFLVCFTIAAAVTDEQRKKAQEVLVSCSQENGVTLDKIAQVRKGDFASADEKTQCVVDCFFKKVGFMNAEGVFQEKVTTDKLSQGEADPSKVSQMVQKCKGESGAGKCETAFKIYKCAFEARAEIL
uniref:Putative pbp/gobp family n=1 Tax=Lutzomyia longipalpis TaxID=7200 RepID=A0A1B0CJS1_LUTLO